MNPLRLLPPTRKLRVFLLSLLYLSLATLDASIENHLKKIARKTDQHSMSGIDFIYMINLDQRPERWNFSLNQLKEYGILPFRFSAVNGWELSLETINDVGVRFSPEMEGGYMATCYPIGGDFSPSHEMIQNYGQNYFCHCLSRGAIGIALSHISILQDALEAGYETIWVMEDDIEVIRDPRILSDLIDELDQLIGKKNWDILFTDSDMRDAKGNHLVCYWAARRPDFSYFSKYNNYALKEVHGTHFRKIGSRWGAHSMILRKSGIKKLLQFYKAHQIFLPYDMDYVFPPGISLFTVIDDVVSNYPKASSDNGGPNYLKKQEMQGESK